MDTDRGMTPSAHWQRQYTTRAPDAVGWYEADPSMSRRLVSEALERGARSVIDVGGGASSLVDSLVDQRIRVAVLDIAEAGLAVARERLGERAEHVTWIVADVTTASDIGRYDVWHDRAVFHFLTEAGGSSGLCRAGDADDRRRRDGIGGHLRSRWSRTVQRASGLSLRRGCPCAGARPGVPARSQRTLCPCHAVRRAAIVRLFEVHQAQGLIDQF